ncbi:hypothetical protein TNCT_622351 [Trichonephila clavata]|uniref:Uncharacterized protein n=1 Tax=Trichonephila clavata TaxID=2740835 RepID=A0A8X6IAE9_TRICU|nr:hypothetical protein TNCT_622351 [Trichonephila clavata]
MSKVAEIIEQPTHRVIHKSKQRSPIIVTPFAPVFTRPNPRREIQELSRVDENRSIIRRDIRFSGCERERALGRD